MTTYTIQQQALSHCKVIGQDFSQSTSKLSLQLRARIHSHKQVTKQILAVSSTSVNSSAVGKNTKNNNITSSK